MRTWTTICGTLASIGFTVACTSSGAGGVGAPCETKADCEGELVCDEHEGQASCQEPHGHGGDSEGTTEHAHESEGTTEHAHDSGSTGHAHDSGSTTEHADSGSTTGTASSEDGSTTTGGGVSAECEAYCGCLTKSCSEYEAYPHVDEAACLAACAGLDAEALTCFSGFCEDAAAERSPDLAEHYCEHAWGELGTDKC